MKHLRGMQKVSHKEDITNMHTFTTVSNLIGDVEVQDGGGDKSMSIRRNFSRGGGVQIIPTVSGMGDEAIDARALVEWVG